MSIFVYDASALLAVIFDEPGSNIVMDCLAKPGGEASAVNWSEIGAKLAERGLSVADISTELATFGLDIVPFDEDQAHVAAGLRPLTADLGLSLGDRCCLALAQIHKARVVTADHAWLKLPGFDVVAIRDR